MRIPPENVVENQETREESQETQVVEVPAELGLSDYKKFYQDMVEVSETASRSMVNGDAVSRIIWTGLTNTYENQRQISGLIIARTSQEIYILTEYRGVEKVDRIQVTFWDDATVDARFQKTDPNTGLTVLKVPLGEIEETTLEQLVTAPLGSSVFDGAGKSGYGAWEPDGIQ